MPPTSGNDEDSCHQAQFSRGEFMRARSIAALVCFISAPLAAQTSQTRVAARPMMASADTSLLRGLRFRMVGPPRGGRVTTVWGVTAQPRTFYMGVASGGLFKTTDAGASWTPITDGKVPL